LLCTCTCLHIKIYVQAVVILKPIAYL
jgi:hypothetical protein